MTDKIWKLLRSAKLALVTMILLTGYSIYGMVLNNSDVFKTKLFFGLSFVFLINLLCCTLEQTRKFRFSQPIYKWGAIVFHWGLVVVTMGCMLSFATRLEGYFIVTEGETRPLEATSFSQLDKALFTTTWPGWDITLEALERHWREDNSLSYTSSLISMKGGDLNSKQWVEKGNPLIMDNWRLFYYDAGYAPGVIVKKGNESLGKVFLQAEKVKVQEKEQSQKNGYLVNKNVVLSDLVINGTFYPDIKTPSNEKLIMPALKITTNQGDKLITGTTSATVGNYTLMLADIKEWVGLQVVYDSGADWVFAGAWLAVGGLVLWYYGRIIRRKHA